MKCPVCNSDVKELYNVNTEREEFKCYGCHLSNIYRRVEKLERKGNI
jgi:hypothetical protein